jgi:hypothetical protein
MKTSIPMFKAAAFVSLLALAACSSMDVYTARAPETHLANYHTYSWAPQLQSPNPPADSILDQTVRASVERQLATRGMKQVPPQMADLLVSYTTLSEVTDTDRGDYGLWGWDWGGLAPPEVRQGTLAVQLVDPHTNRVVWNGAATDVISDTADETQKQVVTAVNEIFKQYG